MVLSFDDGYWFIFLTKWSFFLETIYFCLASYVTYRARASTLLDDARQCSVDVPKQLPWFVQAMYLLWIVLMPTSLLITLVFWTLLDPIWNLNPDINLDYACLAMHLYNAVLFIVELCLNRNVFYLKHAVPALVAYFVMYVAWTLVHFALRLGLPLRLKFQCPKYELRDCPIYPVFDWHRPVVPLVVMVVMAVLLSFVTICLWRIVRPRNRANATSRVAVASIALSP